ncbi:DUF2793 domain-containing protein [Paracoccus spongiarum]|uniref:DUF2793 domain-containing protein n=1 Tax=Paracoccus spongiarum TaxID=3064387 RepID=A0ABT9J7E2_9RHOB|nr:DUF2793 domain-containing protein [Paracoccus sp. 2205BS29-5]MDP5305645.1 DUF2793 domain-containing protein [Paracoccus sp. 2205BS29-5]
MTETNRLAMPLLQPAQAQKHVTVNESLMRLDGLVNLVLASVTTAQPPSAVVDGQCWGVPGGAVGPWAGQAGRIAIGSNGGWVFVPPTAGMRGFVVDQGRAAIHDGTGWVAGAVTMGAHGGAMVAGIAEAEVVVAAGASFDTGVAIPSGAMVIGAVARVTQAITGTLATWRLGSQGANNRFGQGIGTATNSWARGMLGSPMTYYQPDSLVMTAEGGSFSGGRVALALHWWELRLPTSV